MSKNSISLQPLCHICIHYGAPSRIRTCAPGSGVSISKSRMEAANSYLQALQGQHEVMKHQAEIPEKINDKKQAEASAKAETEAVKKIVNEKSSGWGKDP